MFLHNIEKVGDRFGRLVLLAEAPRKGKTRRRAFLCRCDCGTEKTILLTNLKKGLTKSCGCLRDKRLIKLVDGVNSAQHPLYETWRGIKGRCLTETHVSFPLYGGRGIQVCPEWQDSFAKFVEDMGPKPSPSHTIDRIDNGGDYCPDNCRWATWEKQHQNRRDNNNITYLGETLCVAEWSRRLGGNPRLVGNRIQRGWSPIEAVSTPLGETPITINDRF